VKRIVSLLRGGQSLRHAPVQLEPDEQKPVRAVWIRPGGERDVTGRLFPVSLIPLVLGYALGDEEDVPPPGTVLHLRFDDVESGTVVGELWLRAERVLAHDGLRLLLMRPARSAVRCVGAAERAWRYALAWRQARRTMHTPGAFAMAFPDLLALNVFYMMPRPVYLVSVAHGDAGNLFPMDLVGPLGDAHFLMALRRTSPSIEPMRVGWRVVVSGVPGAWKDEAYQLGRHHKERSIDWSALPFPVTPSAVFGIPAPAGALRVRELEVLHAEDVGSHVFFFTRVAGDEWRGTGPQLCHVSDMYARWRAARGRPFTPA